MFFNLTGRIDGRRIELQQDPGLPPGSMVEIKIDKVELSLEERRRRVLATAGAWSFDPGLAFVFDELALSRSNVASRDVNFDGPS